MQTKLQSFTEIIINTIVGYTIAVLSQLIIFPMFGVNLAFTDNLMIANYFTVISIAKGYAIRRFYNWYHNKEQSCL